MADPFGDPSLFEEFDKEQLPCDKILRQKFKTDVAQIQNTSIDEGSDSAISAEFHVGSSDSGSDSESENGFIENEGSDHGGGITGVGDILQKINNPNNDSKQIGKDLSNGKGSNSGVDTERYSRMKIQIEDLMEENLKLKKQARLVSCDKASSQDGPTIQLVFMNNDITRKYKTEIEDFVQHLLENDRNEKLPKLYLRPNCVRLKDKAQKADDSCTAISASHFYTHYMVDSMGWPLVDGTPALTDGWHVPVYEQVYSESLPTATDGEDDGFQPQQKQRKRGSCFNCEGEHSLRECKQPHDQDRINQARREMAENSGPKKQRYILDEGSNKDSKFKAGEISKELRDAMGINSRQLAPYIYQMRKLGYPPGWLAEAEVSTSGVSMFDRHGKEVTNEGESLEDGEVDVNVQPKKAYDSNKLVSYPGFNVTPPEDALDEHEELGMPAMQPHHHKDALALFLTPNQSVNSGKKRKHSNDTTNSGSSSSKKGKYRGNTEDMEIEDQDSPYSESPRRGSKSPTMDSLKAQHLLIQAQLASMEDGSDSEVQVLDSCEDGEISDSSFIPPVPATPEAPPLPPGTPPITPQAPGASSTPLHSFKSPHPPMTPGQVTPSRIPLPVEIAKQVSRDSGCVDTESSQLEEADLPMTPDCAEEGRNGLLRTPSSCGRGGSLSSTSGTPVVIAKNHFATAATPTEGKGLPEASKFAAGIMEHLPFENLPDSTGKYQQMKKVLESIRSTKKKS